MQLDYTPVILPLLAAAVISLFVATYLWPRRQAPGASHLALMALALAPWALGYALEIAGVNLETKIFWGKSQYIGIVFAPYFWLRFAFAYTNQEQTKFTRWLNWIVVLPFITLSLVVTTEWHKLIWDEITILETEYLSVLHVTHGFWFWIHFTYSYLMLFIGAVIILRNLWHEQGLFRAQSVALLIAVLSPWVGNVLYFADLGPIPGLDLTPFALTITVVALAWGIFGYRLGDILPIARDLVIEAMRDGMIVVNPRGRVADINNAASRMIGVPAPQAVGAPITDLFQPWPHILDYLQNEREVTDTITIGEGTAQRHYELAISTLFDTQKTPIGRVITLHEASGLTTPAPRFTARPTQPPVFSPTPETVAQFSNQPFLNTIFNFFVVPAKADLPVPPDVNPVWVQTLERAFTLILRIVAIVGTAAVFFTLPYMQAVAPIALAYGIIIALVWFLGLARNLSFNVRATLFLFLTYTMATVETANFGFSAESFTFFFAFVMLAVLLTELRRGIIALTIALTTIGFFGWQIGSGVYVPGADITAPPQSVVAAASSLLAFASTSTAAIAATSILLRSLNRAWQQESQALNLLGQERDLLEQRVAERTQDLAEARDKAIKSSLELQKYFRAIEQSGNGIFITDPNGNIEYVNPKFIELTGYTMEEARGNNPRILRSGEQGTEFYQHLWQTIQAGDIWQGEMHNRRKDGSLYWQSATIAPVLNQAGEVTHFVAINEDITAQKQLQEQLKRQNDYLSILHQTTLDLLNRQNLDELLPAIVERACALLDAPFGEIMLKEGEYMVVRAFTRNQPYLLGDRIDRQTAKLSWQAHDTGRPVVLENYSAWSGHRAIYNSNPFQAVADFPVMMGETCIGVLALGRTQPGYLFSPEQIEMGVLFARLAALVLDNANLYDSALKEIEERKRAESSLQLINQEQQVLTSILRLGLEDKPVDELLLAILKEILSVSWLNLLAQGGIFLAEGTQKQLTLKAQHNLAPQIQTLCHRIALGQCLCGRAAATRQIQFAQHVDAHHEIQYHGMADHGHYNIPILTGETVLGVIVLYLPPGYQKIEADISFLQTIANTLAGILQRKRAEEQNQAFLEDMKSLQDMHLLLNEVDDTEQLYIQMINLSQRRLGLDRVGLFLLDDTTNILKGTYGISPDGQVRDERYYEEVVTEDHWTLEILNTLTHARVWEDAPLFDDGRVVGTGWKVAAALWNGHKAIGYLICDNYQTQKPIRPYELELISLLGSTFGHLVERKQAEQRLAIARDQALQASRFKSQLLAKVSHEFRTPLGAILGYTELLWDETFGPLSAKQKQIASEVMDSTEYLTSLVGELLDEAQFEANTIQLYPEFFAVHPWLQQIEAKLTVLAQRKGLNFSVNVDPHLPEVLHGDKQRLQQILINLTGNAIKFTKTGTVKVELIRPDAAHWAIRVADTGPGIPPEAQTYIFDPFRQVDGSSTREHRGTGLGLSIVKQLTDIMQGRIELESAVNVGSTFTVWLPLEEQLLLESPTYSFN